MKQNKNVNSASVIKIFLYVTVSFLLAVLQSTLGKRIGLFGVTPQMTLALTVAAAYYQGPVIGALCGIFCGVFTDAIGGTGITLSPLFYTLIGWIIGSLAIEKKGQKGSSLGSFILNLAAATLVGGFITLIMLSLNAAKPNLPDAFIYIVLPEALNTYIFGFFIGLVYFVAERLTQNQSNKKEKL